MWGNILLQVGSGFELRFFIPRRGGTASSSAGLTAGPFCGVHVATHKTQLVSANKKRLRSDERKLPHCTTQHLKNGVVASLQHCSQLAPVNFFPPFLDRAPDTRDVTCETKQWEAEDVKHLHHRSPSIRWCGGHRWLPRQQCRKQHPLRTGGNKPSEQHTCVGRCRRSADSRGVGCWWSKTINTTCGANAIQVQPGISAIHRPSTTPRHVQHITATTTSSSSSSSSTTTATTTPLAAGRHQLTTGW